MFVNRVRMLTCSESRRELSVGLSVDHSEKNLGILLNYIWESSCHGA